MNLHNRAHIDGLLENAADGRKLAGVVAMAADASGPIYAGAFGIRGLAAPTPMTLDSVFHIASMTKAITGVAAMQMVEQGKLKLDQPAGEIIARLGKLEVLAGFTESGDPILRPPKRPVTLRHLLTHTSGYSDDTFSVDIKRFAERTGLPMTSSGKLAALNTPALFDPGEGWA
jgi:CubicO group peptidase (beta-lactamase class C family)